MIRRLLLVLAAILGLAPAAAAQAPHRGAAQVTEDPVYRGVSAIVDLPKSQHVRNRDAPPGSHIGCCTFATLDMMARWHNVAELIGVVNKIQQGGGYPEKMDRVIAQHAPGFRDYVQYTGLDPAILDQAMRDGRPVGVSYGYSERYAPMTSIQHMVLLSHLDQQWACIIDNNFPGTYEWMPRQEFLARWVYPNDHGWAIVFLRPGPPPIPRNLK